MLTPDPPTSLKEPVGSPAQPGAATAPFRQSIEPTYDHRETGDRFIVRTLVGRKCLPGVPVVDPFITHRVTVGWPDLLRGLLRRRLEVTVTLDADREMVEDVLELNGDYLGETLSTRRKEWNEHLEHSLATFAEKDTREHLVSADASGEKR